MADDELLRRVMDWVQKTCDGLWEHGPAFGIDMVDNPGWKVEVFLRQTKHEATPLEELNIDAGDTDWIRCWKKDGVFHGVGDLAKLPQILEYFLQHVDRQ